MIWKSTKSCFEGDGDFIDIEEGAGDPTAIGIGTYYKNGPFAVTETDPVLAADDPLPFSSDLTGALTNAFFTTIDRDPFDGPTGIPRLMKMSTNSSAAPCLTTPWES